MEDIKEEIKCEIRLLLHTKILKVAKLEDLEHTASNILALMEKTDGGATVPCSAVLSAANFLCSFIPEWAKTLEEGLDPTFYGTCTYEGDKKVKERVDEILELLERAGR